MGHGFGSGDGSCIDWHQRHVVRVSSALCPLSSVLCPLSSALWLSSLRGVRSYDCRDGLGSRSGLFGLFVFSAFLFLAPV